MFTNYAGGLVGANAPGEVSIALTDQTLQTATEG